MRGAKEYKDFGINKTRFMMILKFMLDMSEDDLLGYAQEIDGYCAEWLVASIKKNMSYESIEQKNGIIPISKTDFYRKRRLLFHRVDERNEIE